MNLKQKESKTAKIPTAKQAVEHKPAITQETLPTTGYIRISQLIKFLPISKASIWRLSKIGKFPKAIKLTEKTTAFKCEEVQAWLASREAA